MDAESRKRLHHDHSGRHVLIEACGRLGSRGGREVFQHIIEALHAGADALIMLVNGERDADQHARDGDGDPTAGRELLENRSGIREWTARFDRRGGPSRKPACAATNSSAASVISEKITRTLPIGQVPNTFPRSTAFIVRPGTGCEFVSR